MTKRAKLEIIKDILEIIRSHNSIKQTPLIRKSNLSTARFKEYYTELLSKGMIKEISGSGGRLVSLTEKGYRYLDKYRNIIGFIEEFEL